MLIIKKEGSQVNDINFCLKKLEKEQVKPKTNQRKTIIEIKEESNAVKNIERVEGEKSINLQAISLKILIN